MRTLIIASCVALLGIAGVQAPANAQIRLDVPGFDRDQDHCDADCRRHREFEHDRELRRERWERDHPRERYHEDYRER